MREWKTAAGEIVTLKGIFIPRMTCSGCRSNWDMTHVSNPEGNAAAHAASCREVSRRRRRD